MAIKDTTKKPYIEDRDENIFIGIDLPFRKSNGREGYFASTSTTIEAVKNNIKNLLRTEKGERLMQPNLGLKLRRLLFEQYDDDLIEQVKLEIISSFNSWLPFVEIREVNINLDSNIIYVDISFNITKDPNTLESVSVTITGE